MAITDVLKRALACELRLSRGRVTGLGPGGQVRLTIGAGPGPEIACDVLHAMAGDAPGFEPGQEVLVAFSADPEQSGVILGGIGPAGAAAQESPAASAAAGEPLRLTHREIVIEAGEELTLRCGQASIHITRDGKIVIRGEHILSRAKGTQRIKGGSVAIN